MRTLVLLIYCITGIASAFAQGVCGDPPPVANETLKGEIQGKAQVLSRYVGNAELGGKIETSRSEIFSRYPNGDQARSNAYFEYQVCVLIMTDRSLDSMSKLEELKKVKREFAKPVKQKHSVIFQSENGTFIDNTLTGWVGSSSTITILINEEPIVKFRTSESLGSTSLMLNEGENTFKITADITGERRIRGSCGGVFQVIGSGVYSPRLVFQPIDATHGRITSCGVSKVS